MVLSTSCSPASTTNFVPMVSTEAALCKTQDEQPPRFLRFPTDTSCFSAWNMDDGYPAVLHHKGAGNICSTVQQPSRVASLYLFPQYRGQERIVIPSRFGEGSQRSFTVGQVMDTTLPIDTLVNVFKHLDLASKACALCVCKEWHRAGKQFERSWQLMHVFVYAGITVESPLCFGYFPGSDPSLWEVIEIPRDKSHLIWDYELGAIVHRSKGRLRILRAGNSGITGRSLITIIKVRTIVTIIRLARCISVEYLGECLWVAGQSSCSSSGSTVLRAMLQSQSW